MVEAAALHAQNLKDAPASVTVISRQELLRYGWRTLAEVLSHARSFYMTHDSAFWFAGVRGYSLPGDWNSRILIMINGHILTDNVYNVMHLFGREFPLDLDLVERIEIIRGPFSALYGSNGVFATVNLVTRSPVDAEPASASIEVASFGEKRAMVAAAAYLGRGANLLAAASAYHGSGREVYLPEYDAPETGFGHTRGAGREQGYHGFAQLIWRGWSFTACFNERRASMPVGLYGTIFGDPGTWNRDGHNFIESVWARAVGREGGLRLRVWYDQYRYRGRYDYAGDGEVVLDQRDNALGDWVGTQFHYWRPVRRIGRLTMGAEFNADIRNLQETYLIQPVYEPQLHVPARDVLGGVFAQQEWTISGEWTFLGGVRFDASRNYHSSASPRAALVWRPAPTRAWKFIYGEAFRNPSAYETFYSSADSSYVANLALRPERMRTWEVAGEFGLARRVQLITSLYHYRMRDLIRETRLSSGGVQFQNLGRARATGVEGEILARPSGLFELVASLAVQSAVNGETGDRLANSPNVIAQWRAAAPLFTRRLTLTLAWRYLSSRLNRAGEPAPGVPVLDGTLTTNRLHRNFDVQFGVRNLFNRRYRDPLSWEHPAAWMPRPGRTVFLRLLWSHGG